MNAQELLIEIRPDAIDVSVMVNDLDMQRAIFSHQKGSEMLIAWLKKYVVGSAYARMQVAGADDMRLALDLARVLADAGHTVSVGNICRFSPAQSTEREDLTESPPFEESRRERVDMLGENRTSCEFS